MASLRILVDDHYQNRISFSEYREKRGQLLRLIDEDLNGVSIVDDQNTDDITARNSVISKAISFLTNR